MNKVLKNINGFTLIELLIAVVIIGVLSTLLLANFVGVRQRARDSQRKSDIRQIQSALEIYRSDQGSYPSASGTTLGACATALQAGSPAVNYMTKIPCDPAGASYYNSGNYYFTSSGGTTYTLGACLENTADSQGTTDSPGLENTADSQGTTDSPGSSGCSSATYFVVNQP